MKTSQCCRAVENRCVFSARLKALSDRSDDRSAGGRRFHVAGPLTVKLHCPVAVRARGTTRICNACGNFIVVTKQEIRVISPTVFFDAASRRHNDVILTWMTSSSVYLFTVPVNLF